MRKETESPAGKDASDSFWKMTREEFIKAAVLSGYASETGAAAYTERAVKSEYTDRDFIELYHTNMHWSGVAADKGLLRIKNGKTTAFSHGIRGNSGPGQDWA